MLAQKRNKQAPEPVELPSGLVFELRRPDLQAFVITGRYPQSIVHEGMKALKELGIAPNDPQAAETVLANMDAMGLSDALIFMREMVREACVHPRLVVGARGDDELEPGDLDLEDFNFIVSWCLNYKGVKNADGIRSFRTGQERGTVSSQHDGEILQPETIGDTTD